MKPPIFVEIETAIKDASPWFEKDVERGKTRIVNILVSYGVISPAQVKQEKPQMPRSLQTTSD